jgi:hypothetical protein
MVGASQASRPPAIDRTDDHRRGSRLLFAQELAI